MTTADYINQNYDRNILGFIFSATIAVLVLITVFVTLGNISTSWYLLPLSWWVGGMMVWGFGKFQNKYNR